MRSQQEIDEWFAQFRKLLADFKQEQALPPDQRPPLPPSDPVDEALEAFLETPMRENVDMLVLDDAGTIVFVESLALWGPFAVRFTLPELATLAEAMAMQVVARVEVRLRDFEHTIAGDARCWPRMEDFLAPDSFVDDGELWADLDRVDEGTLLKLVDLWEVSEARRWHAQALDVLLDYVQGRLGSKALARPSEA